MISSCGWGFLPQGCVRNTFFHDDVFSRLQVKYVCYTRHELAMNFVKHALGK